MRKELTATRHADPVASIITVLIVTRLPQTVADPVHTARRNSSRPSREVLLGVVNWQGPISLQTPPVWRNSRAFARDLKGRGFKSRPVRFQVTALRKRLSISIIWYRPIGGNVVNCRPGGKKRQPTYHRVDGLKATCGLYTGIISGPNATLSNECGRTIPFFLQTP